MNTYPHLAFVYFNGEKPPYQFRVTDDTHPAALISKLNTLLRYLENRRVVKLKYRPPSFDTEKKLQFTNFELKKNEDLEVTWSTFRRYATEGPNEVDAKIARPVENIINML
ncbi:uncharacterized protein LOC131649330 [Vicia villosa]|uniref:uncharacterized protein LOC131649330 n=1 Tax=Vicia villosa TaxID=3911 RepID=UPI00273BFA6C|nr:uncharacterized protein LOC131649330 [Vicia villosa]